MRAVVAEVSERDAGKAVEIVGVVFMRAAAIVAGAARIAELEAQAIAIFVLRGQDGAVTLDRLKIGQGGQRRGQQSGEREMFADGHRRTSERSERTVPGPLARVGESDGSEFMDPRFDSLPTHRAIKLRDGWGTHK